MIIYKQPQSMTAAQNSCFIAHSRRFDIGLRICQKRFTDSILETQQRLVYIKRKTL